LKDGRFLDDGDLRERRRVVVLGQKSAALLFPGRPALGESVLVDGTSFEVVGVAEKTGRGNDDGTNQQLYVPLTTMLELFPIKGDNIPRDAMTSIQYQPRTRGENEAAKAAARSIIAARHGFTPDDPDAFQEWDTIKSDQLVGKIFTAMDVFLGGVGIVTLALGAVGIVNIMLVSVSERTREIGLRKAIGATHRSILMQFFLEGLLLTGVSGLIGIGGSALFMYLIQVAIGGHSIEGFDPPRLVPWSAALAMISLSLSGIFAGLYPASKAAALEPVEALRRE
jgi:putative ABC transport system permease protein